MMIKKKNLILGTISGYKFYIIEPFLTSLRLTGYAGDIVLFHSKIDQRTLSRLAEAGITLVPFQKNFPYLDPGFAKNIRWAADKRLRTLSVYCLRYLLAYCYLSEVADEYQNVMLTDVRDVIFQKDPFDFALGAELCCFGEKEGVTLGEDAINAHWIECAFDTATLEGLSNNQISCAGVTIGPSALVLNYLEKMVDFIVQAPGKGWELASQVIGIDQGVHNYVVNNCLLTHITHYENNRGPVFTLVLEDSVRMNGSGHVINKYGDVPNVVHQYDRHWQIAKRHYGFRLQCKYYFARACAPISKGLRMYAPTIHGALLRARKLLFRS